MQSMNDTLKNNKQLLKKRKSYKKIVEQQGAMPNEPFLLRKASKEELKAAREKLEKEKNREKKRLAIAAVVFTSIVALLVYRLVKFF